MQQYAFNGFAESRPYFVYTPANYAVGKTVPLFVMLHGCGQTAADFAAGTAMNQLAEHYGFIVVYPQQTSRYNINGCWNWFHPAHQSRERGEPASIAGMVRAMQQDTMHWTIDPQRIYVAGLSAGASMAVILGATYPDLFAAIGVHSGLEYQAATTPMSAVQAMRRGGPDSIRQGQVAYAAMNSVARTVPTIIFHGTSDTTVSPINGDQTVQQWMHTNQLASHGEYAADFHHPTDRKVVQVPGTRSYTISTWKSGNASDVQAYWQVNGLGHAWSGGSPGDSFTDPHGPKASLAMYHFFMDHPMGGVDNEGTSLWGNLRRIFTSAFTPHKRKEASLVERMAQVASTAGFLEETGTGHNLSALDLCAVVDYIR